MGYIIPKSLDEALDALNTHKPTIVAGGTDFYPALSEKQAPEKILDVSGVPELRGITRTDEGWRIGASTRWSDITRAELPGAFDGLKLAAKEVGSLQIQNAGTVAGNICNASPAADGVPPLLTLNALVELSSGTGKRTMSLSDFITGVRATELAEGELVSALLIPSLPENATSSFLKLGGRKYLVISIAMAAAVLSCNAGGAITEARVAVGACSPVAQRLPALEASLIGKTAADLADPNLVTPDHLAPLSPISDVRGSADYRKDVVATLCQRIIVAAATPQGGSVG